MTHCHGDLCAGYDGEQSRCCCWCDDCARARPQEKSVREDEARDQQVDAWVRRKEENRR